MEAGIRPSTYVWRKGLDDWRRASEDPEICRAMRRYLAGFDPETGLPLPSPGGTPAGVSTGTDLGKETGVNPASEQRISIRSIPEPPDNTNYSFPPTGVSIVMAIVMTICCFPPTGLLAIFYAMRCKAQWKMSEQEGIDDAQQNLYRRKSHDDARIYRMTIGITFFLGLIMVGVTLARTLM